MNITHDILLAIDADTIIQTFGLTTNSQKSPAGVGSAHVTAMTSADKTNSIGVFDISVEVGDSIRWYIASPGFQYSCYIYNFIDTLNKNDISESGIILQPTPMAFPSQTYTPNSDPTKTTQPTPQKIKDCCWNTTVVATGNLSYGIQFIVFDNSENPLMYCEYVGELGANP